MEELFKNLDRIVKESEVEVDRPKGSKHPRFDDYEYPMDYGFLKGTTSGDGHGIDVWIGSGDQKEITGIIIIADAMKKDSEIKVLLGCDQEEQQTALKQANIGDMRGALITRENK